MVQGRFCMNDYLMVGTEGLDVDAWAGDFYDEDLPVDWRAASYSTLLRSVLLHEHEWKKAIEEDWAAEVDEGFRFVLYAGIAEIETLMALPENLARKVAGVIIEISSLPLTSRDRDALQGLAERVPVSIDVASEMEPQQIEEINGLCRQLDISRVWHPSAQAVPLETGSLLVAILSDEGLPEQREIISVLDVWMTELRTAGIFHGSVENAPQHAQQTRLLAEMMGA